MPWPHLLLATSCIVGLLLVAALLSRRDNRSANLLLGLIISLALFYQWTQWEQLNQEFGKHPYLVRAAFPVSLLIPSLVYLYILALTVPGFRYSKRLLPHLLPFGFGIMVFSYYSIRDASLGIAGSPPTAAERYVCTILDVVISGTYFYFCFRRLRDYRRQLSDYFSDLRQVRLNWLIILLSMFVFPWFVQLLDVFTGPLVTVEHILVPVITAVFLLMGFFGLRQSMIFTPEEFAPPNRRQNEGRDPGRGRGTAEGAHFLL